MEIEKYSPKCLLEKINDSKTDAHKLMHIIEYRKEIVESTEKQLTLTDSSQQRELLENFADWMDKNVNFDGIRQNEIDSYLKEKEIL